MSIPPGRVVSVYRAITGAYNPTSGKNAGVIDQDLRERGIFTDNGSSAQTKESFLSEDLIGTGQFVIGLPIFTTREQAQKWINGRTYEKTPAIVQLDIPVELLMGDTKLAIINNDYTNPNLNRLLTQDELNKLSNGEKIELVGECVLRGVLGNKLDLHNTGGISKELQVELRRHEKIFRPSQLPDTGPLRDAVYKEVKLPLEPNEGSSELSRS